VIFSGLAVTNCSGNRRLWTLSPHLYCCS